MGLRALKEGIDMNKVVCGIAGFALGIFTGGIIVNTVYKKIVNRILDEKEELQEELNRKTKLADAAINEVVSRANDYCEKHDYKTLVEKYSSDDEVFEDEDDAPVDEYGEVIEDEFEFRLCPRSRYDENGEEMSEITVSSTKPYQIPPEEFEVYDEYESDSYTWYPDGWVTDSEGLPVDPNTVKELFGIEYPTWFGTYADDEVWVRNDVRKMDFSITKDAENFEDIATPRQRRLAGI